MNYSIGKKKKELRLSTFICETNAIVKEDVLFLLFLIITTPLQMYSRFQANNMNAEMPKKSRPRGTCNTLCVQLLPICSGLF